MLSEPVYTTPIRGLIRPYYDQDGITIYHGDCRDVIDEWDGLRTQSFDLLLTDPPYGVGVASIRGGAGKAASAKWPGAQ